jgi:TonB family protein
VARAAWQGEFSAYIAQMHRSIHDQWGFGQILVWDEQPRTSPLNNVTLLATLELVLNGDGTIDNIKVVRSSGLRAYDVAAIDVAYSAGPYPSAPKALRSANGKIYIHWDFHRDDRQCATSGVTYYILSAGTNPGVLDASPRPSPATTAGSAAVPGKTRDGQNGAETLKWLHAALSKVRAARAGSFGTIGWSDQDVSVLVGMSRAAIGSALGEPDVCPLPDKMPCPFHGDVAYKFFRLRGRGGGPNLVLTFDAHDSCSNAHWELTK